MKKKCVSAIVCILLSVLLLSCGALTRPMERHTVVELHITGIREYQNSTAGARVLSDSFKDASLTINIMGDYHAEQTVKLTTETTSVSFSGIPVGARIQAAASVTTADGTLTYTGKSAEIIVSAGVNTLAVTIDQPDITTVYVAWDCDYYDHNLYVADTAATLATQPQSLGDETQMIDFCFDWDNNVYVLCGAPDVFAGTVIAPYNIRKIPQGETTLSQPRELSDTMTLAVGLTCDNGNLYVLDSNQNNTIQLWKYACADFGGTETPVSGTSIALPVSGLDLSVHKPVIAAANGTLYLAAPYTDKTWKVSAWTINDGGTATEKYSIDLLSSTGLTAVDTSDDIGATSVNWNTFRVSDLLVQDGAVYALLNEVTNDDFTTFSPNTSRGAVVKLTDTGSALSVDTGFGSNGLLGWTAAPQSLPYGNAADSTTVDCYWPASDNTNEFYGPAKFAAVKPKKLVIADDGAIGSPLYSDGTTYNQGTITDKDRIIEVDLLNEQFTDIHLFEKETIEFDFAGWGSSSWTGVS